MKTINLCLVIILFVTHVKAQPGLTIDQGTNINYDGYLSIGGEYDFHMLLDRQSIQSKFAGSNNSTILRLNPLGGIVSIGNFIYYKDDSQFTGIGTYYPEARLHLFGNNDASLTSNGLFMVGNADTLENIIIDKNEIMARDNGNPSTLYINNWGGDVQFFGAGAGNFIVKDIPMGNHVNLQYETSTGKFYHDNSSRRFKDNITTLKDDWRKILKARPVAYTRPSAPSRWEYGYIAEDIDSIGLTTMVGYDMEGRPEYVHYDKMIIYLVEILKLQQEEIQALRQEMKDLTTKKKRKTKKRIL